MNSIRSVPTPQISGMTEKVAAVDSSSMHRPRGSDSIFTSGLSLTTKNVKVAESQGMKVSVGEEELIRIIERANKALQGSMTTFEFSIHEKTKEIMVKVMDKDSGEVIREIPPEKVLDMVAKLWELAGILVDERR